MPKNPSGITRPKPVPGQTPLSSSTFMVNGKLYQFHGRMAEMLSALKKGPVPAPCLKRNSSSVHLLCKAGIDIWTEPVHGPEATTGIYHLRGKARRATAAEVEKWRLAAAKAKAEKAKARKAVAK